MKRFLAFLLMIIMLFLVSCSNKEEKSEEIFDEKITLENIKVGFIYSGKIDDKGITQIHDKGRIALNEMGINTEYVEEVPENDESILSIESLVEKGCHIIYTTSSAYNEHTKTVADKYPEVRFANYNGNIVTDNMSVYSARNYEASYLSGMVAGMKTKSNKIGFVAGKETADAIVNVNAFTLGARSVNPKATVEVVFTDRVSDTNIEKTAALTLLTEEKGIDIIAQHLNSTAVLEIAELKGAFAIGYNFSAKEVVPKAYLTSPILALENYYIRNVQSIIDETWTNKPYNEGFSDNVVAIDELSNLVAEGTLEKVNSTMEKIKSGEFKIFSGEIKDQDGEVRVFGNLYLSDDEILQMNYFIEGVVGRIPE